MAGPALTIRGLSKRFELHIRGGLQVTALRSIDLEVERGEFVGLVGASGSGKSSLLKCLYRTYEPQSGAAVYQLPDGSTIDLATTDEHVILRLRRRNLGYVSQFLRVIPRVTVDRTVAMPLLDRGVELEEALRVARLMLERLNVGSDLFGSFPSLLSGGEQQRVNIARAAVSSPDLLLLDEPTSALDSRNQEAVVGVLEELRTSGTTMLGAFHDSPKLAGIANRVARLDGGRIVDLGVPANVLSSELEAVS